jgi:AcrR family transcriptional regulator
VSPRAADPRISAGLIDASARILAAEGPAALSARRLAQEVGTSTTAVYTYFGSMAELRRAVRREGFARFAGHLASVPEHDDPMRELAELGLAYIANAFENPDLYRVMFMEGPLDEADATTGWDTFQRLVDAIQRSLDRGLFPRCRGARQGASQLWAVTHGAVSLALAGLITRAEAEALVGESALGLFAGWGFEAAPRSAGGGAGPPGARDRAPQVFSR